MKFTNLLALTFALLLSTSLFAASSGSMRLTQPVQLNGTQIKPGDYPLSLIARTIDAAEAGDPVAARAFAKRLVQLQPAFGRNPRGALERYGAVPRVIDRIAAGLAKAGMVGQAPADN